MPGTVDVEQAWLGLSSCVARVTRALDVELRHRVGLLLSECDALAAVDAPPRRCATMTEIGAAAGLSASGVTRVVGRLAASGLLERRRDSRADSRLLWVVLTDAGRERLGYARRVRIEVLRRELAPALPDLPECR